jgi:hypothetical protein
VDQQQQQQHCICVVCGQYLHTELHTLCQLCHALYTSAMCPAMAQKSRLSLAAESCGCLGIQLQAPASVYTVCFVLAGLLLHTVSSRVSLHQQPTVVVVCKAGPQSVHGFVHDICRTY